MPAHVHVMFTRLSVRRYNTAGAGPDCMRDQTTVWRELAGEYDWTLEAAAPQQQSKPNLPSGLDFDAITEQSCAELQLPVNP